MTQPFIYVYLAGPIDMVSEDRAMSWRETAQEFFIENSNVLRGINPYRNIGEPDHGGVMNRKLIHRRDKFLTRQSHICLADLREDDGRGTLIELGMFEEQGKPVFGWGGPRGDRELGPNRIDPYEHPMIRDIVTTWERNLIPLCEIILEMAP